MARKSRVDLHEEYQERLNTSRRWREEEQYDELWRRLRDLYRGKHWPMSTMAQRDLIAVNLAFSTINVIAPSVAVNHPKIVVTANEPGNEPRAAFVEAVANYLWRHHDFRAPFRRAVKDFLIFGHGWIKVGWRFLEQERLLSMTERGDMLDQAMLEVDMFAAEVPDMAGDLPTNQEVIANLPDTTMSIVEDQPFVERISPFDVFVDPEATCIDDLTWIAQRIVRPLAEAQADRRYRPAVRKRLTSDGGITRSILMLLSRTETGSALRSVSRYGNTMM